MQHDFFLPWPVYDASGYVCSAIFHDYNDADLIGMLRTIVPALGCAGPDSRLLRTDVVVPERGGGAVRRDEEAQYRQPDLLISAFFGAQEMAEKGWKSLFCAADTK